MMVTFVSQCEKKALKRTRRVLDSFADRIGDNTWQTIITEEGLSAVKKLLRKTASKSTAVSCHWIRSRARSDLIWTVGNKNHFNRQGRVPVNRTQIDVLHSDWENGWQSAASIQIVAVIAALLHDIGKASVGFQNKLHKISSSKLGDPYRHEWISLRLFQALIRDCKDDTEWLTRFATLESYLAEHPEWIKTLVIDSSDANSASFKSLPPLAKWVSWLIVSHHRLPIYKGVDYFSQKVRKQSQRFDDINLTRSFEGLFRVLSPTNHWVRNPKSCAERADNHKFWQFSAQALESNVWQRQLTRWTTKALNYPPLLALTAEQVSNPFVLQLSRLCLMVGDHNYSSLSTDDKRCVKGDRDFKTKLIANTDRATGDAKQALDEHLLGVAEFTAKFSRALPQLRLAFPAIDEGYQPLAQNTNSARFKWQNAAYHLAKKLQPVTQKQGFFGVNMASTGHGKTLGNARIMHALGDPDTGARFTVALGLRVLTLQTGRALRKDLSLGEDDVAVLVGGAYRELFAQEQARENNASIEAQYEQFGSESLANLVDGEVDGAIYTDTLALDTDGLLGTVIEDPKAKKLLYAPIVSCTIDHIINASECSRGGRHIAPILRLLSSDLILDEPDDFNQTDFPALARLVHLAGLFGSKVLLSSATLTPDFVEGLFSAYSAGRHIWNQQNNITDHAIVCAWIDEFTSKSDICLEVQHYESRHRKFVTARQQKLAQKPLRHWAESLPITLPAPTEKSKVDYAVLADQLLETAQKLHQQNYIQHPQLPKTASIGLIRLANIEPLISLAKAIYKSQVIAEDTQIHLVCYHAKQLLILRHSLESSLDRILKRGEKKGEQVSIFDHPEIQLAVAEGKPDKDGNFPKSAQHHIFIVLATAVAEVGRDHDYDWAIVEPSSMRSMIQLAGRVWRHRPNKIAEEPNILVMDSNIKALSYGNSLGVGHPVFQRPGFEEEDQILLESHKISEIVTKDQLKPLDSASRTCKPEKVEPKKQLSDLEHVVTRTLLNSSKINFVNAFWYLNTASRATVHLQKISPFREQYRHRVEYISVPDEGLESGFSFKLKENILQSNMADAPCNNKDIVFTEWSEFIAASSGNSNNSVRPWLENDLSETLAELAGEKEMTVENVAFRYGTVELDVLNNGGRYYFHPNFGFWTKQ